MRGIEDSVEPERAVTISKRKNEIDSIKDDENNILQYALNASGCLRNSSNEMTEDNLSSSTSVSKNQKLQQDSPSWLQNNSLFCNNSKALKKRKHASIPEYQLKKISKDVSSQEITNNELVSNYEIIHASSKGIVFRRMLSPGIISFKILTKNGSRKEKDLFDLIQNKHGFSEAVMNHPKLLQEHCKQTFFLSTPTLSLKWKDGKTITEYGVCCSDIEAFLNMSKGISNGLAVLNEAKFVPRQMETDNVMVDMYIL